MHLPRLHLNRFMYNPFFSVNINKNEVTNHNERGGNNQSAKNVMTRFSAGVIQTLLKWQTALIFSPGENIYSFYLKQDLQQKGLTDENKQCKGTLF